MIFQDYYKILGVSSDATRVQIKTAYWSKAKIYHPDLNSSRDANQTFALINEAYEVLTDEDARSKFDLNYRNRHAKIRPVAADRRTNFEQKQPAPKLKDLRESHPFLFHIVFLFGMCVGFFFILIGIAGIYSGWKAPFVFIVMIILGIAFMAEGYNGIKGKKS